MKTNATRLLDTLGIHYELREYEVELEDLSAVHVAQQIGMPAAQVYKTLVGKGDRTGIIMAVVAGNAEIDLKALARASGNRRVELTPVSELQHLTGYIRGGVTALCCKKPYPVFLDEDALECDVISVSAGVRGTQILLRPTDYAQVTKATYASISRPAPE